MEKFTYEVKSAFPSLSAFCEVFAVVLSWVYWLKGMRPGDEKAEVFENPANE